MKNKDAGILVLRLTVGILMLFHGINKVMNGVGGISDMLESKGIPAFIAFGVYIGEVIVPILLIVGFRTRIASIFLFINMLVIVFIAHPNWLFELEPHGGWKLELAGFYLFLSVVLFLTGGGKYAISTRNRWD